MSISTMSKAGPVLADLFQRLQTIGRDGDLGTKVVEHGLHDFLIDLHILGHQHALAGERPNSS